jgi:hypothetical protein
MEANSNHWNDKRQRIYDWMVANDQTSYAELYKGAVINLHGKIPGYVRFVSHAVRDLMNGMAACKKGVKREQTQYVQLVDTLNVLWVKHGLPKGPETFKPADSLVKQIEVLSVHSEIAIQIQMLLRDHAEGRSRSEDSPYLFFEVFLPNPVSRDEIAPAYPKMWKSLRAWFMDECHESGELPGQEVIDQIESKFDQVEAILLAVADRYLNTISTLDEILDAANS